jgi:hypothetical protein
MSESRVTFVKKTDLKLFQKVRSISMLLICFGVLAFVVGCQDQKIPLKSVEAEKFNLTIDGKTTTCITLAETASVPEKNAAKELAAYLKKVTGAEFFIVKPGDAAGLPVIAVGPGAAKALVPDIDLVKAGEKGLGEDGIIVKTIPAKTNNHGLSLVLTGAEGSKRGTLYAVYEFLEREVGVRWWTHTEEFVPEESSLTIRPLDVRYKPDLFFREVYSWGIIHIGTTWGYNDSDESVRDWDQARFAARQRNNGSGTVLPASLGGSLVPLGRGHTFYPFLPPETYFKDHPEWYSERGGKRLESGAQLCMTNDEMLKELSNNILEKIREQPHLGMVHVSQNDNRGNCQCVNCKALDDAEGSPSASMLYGVNKVADAIAVEFPDFYVATFAYQYTRTPPKTLKPRPNVIVQYCTIERSATQPIDSDDNRNLMNDLEGWGAVAPKLLIWDYTMNMSGPMTPHPNWPVWSLDFRAYRDNNAVGIFAEGESVGITDFIFLKVYLMSKLMWNPDRDEREIMDEFLNGYYGEAGPLLYEVLGIYAEAGSKTRLPSCDAGPSAAWLDLSAMNRATTLFDQAQAAITDDPIKAARVKVARISLDHQWLQGYANYREQAKESGSEFLGPQDLAKAVADFSAYIRAIVAAAPEDYIKTHMSNLVQFVFMGKTFNEYLGQLAWQTVGRKPGSLPAMFKDVPPENIINMDDTMVRVILRIGADVVVDPKSTSGLAMRVPQAKAPSWGVQATTDRFDSWGGFGRYRVYGVIRCELKADQGAAFVGGVWDGLNRRGLGAVSFPIGKPAPPLSAEEIDANPTIQFDRITSGKPVTDGEYHVYDFGAYDLSHANIVVWVGTTTGDMFVERFIFVREELPEGQGPWDASAQAAYTKLHNEKNYVDARTYLDGIDFTASERLKGEYVSYQLSLDRAEGKKASSVNTAKAQAGAYITKIGLGDPSWIHYNVLSHLFDSLADKQPAYYYYKSIEVPDVSSLPVIATQRYAVRACVALNKLEEAKAISIAIGDSK